MAEAREKKNLCVVSTTCNHAMITRGFANPRSGQFFAFSTPCLRVAYVSASKNSNSYPLGVVFAFLNPWGKLLEVFSVKFSKLGSFFLGLRDLTLNI